VKLQRCLLLLVAVVVMLPAHPAGTVFKIRASRCQLDPIDRASSGFRIQGTEGILTALHGVADCGSITAESTDPAVSVLVRVERQDARRDAALLVPLDNAERAKLAEVESALTRFRALSAGEVLAPGLDAVSIGFPSGVLTAQRNSFLRLGMPSKERLGNILGTGNGDIVQRGSPDVGVSVIKLEGTVNKGESGAPVLLPARGDAVIGLVLGSPNPGSSTLAWVAPIAELQWSLFDPARWRTRPVPHALADAVADDGPAMTLSLSLMHGEQIVRTPVQWPLNFELVRANANTAFTDVLMAASGTSFESGSFEDGEAVGITRRELSFQNERRLARVGLNFQSSASSPRMAYRGTVVLVQSRKLPERHSAAEIKVAKGLRRGLPFGSRVVEFRTEGTWERFRLTDEAGAVMAEGPVGTQLPNSMADGASVRVDAQGSQVTIEFRDPAPVPKPPSVLIVE
jgi:hypothetical protein